MQCALSRPTDWIPRYYSRLKKKQHDGNVSWDQYERKRYVFAACICNNFDE